MCVIFEQVILSQQDIHLCFFSILTWKINCDSFALASIVASSLAFKVTKLECTLKNAEASKNCSTLCSASRKIARSRIRTVSNETVKISASIAQEEALSLTANIVSFCRVWESCKLFREDSPPAGARVSPRPPLSPLLFFLSPSSPSFPTSAFLSVLPSSLCIPWGITRPSVYHVSSPWLARSRLVRASGRCCFLGNPPTIFYVA